VITQLQLKIIIIIIIIIARETGVSIGSH